MRGVPAPGLLGELDAPCHCLSNQWRSNGSISEDGADLIWHGFEHVLQKLPGRLPVSFLYGLGQGKLARAVDANEQEELSFSSLHFGDVYAEEADRVAFELRPLRVVALDVRQA